MEKSYVKRLIQNGEVLAYGTTSGYIFYEHDGITRSVNLGVAVRDVCFQSETTLFACLESGVLVHIDFSGAEEPEVIELYQTDGEPLWSVALNASGTRLAVGERIGFNRIFELNQHLELTEVASVPSRIPKRMKWIHDDMLFVTHSDSVERVYWQDGQWLHDPKHYRGHLNTVEDFILRENDTLLVGVTYSRCVLVWHLETAELLNNIYWHYELAKGIIEAPNSQSDFYVYGRDLAIKKFTIHDYHVFCAEVVNDITCDRLAASEAL
jgi:WD40 repeat protein